MGRSSKSHAAVEEVTKKVTARLKPPYSQRVGGNHIVVYASIPKVPVSMSRLLILSFAEMYAARFMIDKIINNEAWQRAGDARQIRPTIVTASGIRIGSDQLEAILKHEMTVEELVWSDDQVSKFVLEFKYGQGPRNTVATVDGGWDQEGGEGSDGDIDPGELSAGDGNNVPGRIDQRENRRTSTGAMDQGRSSVPGGNPGLRDKPSKRGSGNTSKAVSREGLISAGDIAKDLGVDARDVRGVLRASGRTKPENGWAFTPAEAATVKAEVTAALNKDGKTKKVKK